METPNYTAFLTALADRGQPKKAFDALCALTAEHVGVKLFTLMTRDPVEGYAERIYSNMPDAYPVSGRKPANRTRWSEEVIEQRRIFVANDIEFDRRRVSAITNSSNRSAAKASSTCPSKSTARSSARSIACTKQTSTRPIELRRPKR